MGIVHFSGRDEFGADGVIERADLFVGVRDHDGGDVLLAAGVLSERCDPIGVAGVDADLVAGEQRVEFTTVVIDGVYRR